MAFGIFLPCQIKCARRDFELNLGLRMQVDVRRKGFFSLRFKFQEAFSFGLVWNSKSIDNFFYSKLTKFRHFFELWSYLNADENLIICRREEDIAFSVCPIFFNIERDIQNKTMGWLYHILTQIYLLVWIGIYEKGYSFQTVTLFSLNCILNGTKKMSQIRRVLKNESRLYINLNINKAD